MSFAIGPAICSGGMTPKVGVAYSPAPITPKTTTAAATPATLSHPRSPCGRRRSGGAAMNNRSAPATSTSHCAPTSIRCTTSRGRPAVVWPKFPTRLTYADGNFGQTTAGLPRDVVQRMLVGAQWLVLVAGALLLFMAAPPERRLPQGLRGWLKVAGVAAAVVVLGVIGAGLYATPTLGVIPPEQIAGPIAKLIPQPSPAVLGSPERAALAARGRYVFSVASCAMCHGLDGSGGLKVDWKPFGTLWVRNITPDSATGIGRWSDPEIARAIRAGVSRDGRALHWQGMTWDHASNWDEEDVRALIVYLRALPPVRHAVPAPRPPAPDDCVVYSFWVKPSAVPGCR